MNNSTNFTDFGHNRTYLPEWDLTLLFLTWECVDALLTVLTNTTTLFILWRNHLLETPSNILIACLTVADLSSVLGIPFRASTYYSSSELGWNVSCVAYLLIFCGTSLVNCVSLCLIAIDRLIYVTYSLQYYSLKPVKRAKYVVYLTWGLSALFSIMCISLGYKYKALLGHDTQPLCIPPYSMTFASKMTMCVPYYIVIPITIGVYIKIGCVAWKQKRSIKKVYQPQSQTSGDFKITKVILNVLVVYALCNLCTVVIPTVYYKPEKLPGHIESTIILLSIQVWEVNRWINPFIYAGKSKKFRGYVVKLFTGSFSVPSATYTRYPIHVSES